MMEFRCDSDLQCVESGEIPGAGSRRREWLSLGPRRLTPGEALL